MATAVLAAAAFAQSPLGTAFTYQGLLKHHGTPATGQADLRCRLYDAPTGGNLIAADSAAFVSVTDGLFTVRLDFGAAAFNGQARWLEIEVEFPSGQSNWTILSPRQELTAVPHASWAAGPWTSGATGALTYTDGNVGVGTSTPNAKFHARNTQAQSHAVMGEASGQGSTAVFGYQLGNGNGVMGQNAAGGLGVYGVSSSGTGVVGYSQAGGAIGRLGDPQYAVYGEKPGGYAGYFDGNAYFSGNVGLGAPGPQAKLHIGGTPGTDGIMFPDGTLQTTAATAGLTLPYAGTVASSTPAFSVTNTGPSNAGVFTSYGGHALFVMTYSDFWALRVETQGGGCAGNFVANSTTNTAPALAATHVGGGPAFYGYTYGAAPAGKFEINNPGSSSSAVYAITNGSGPAVLADGGLDVGSATRDGQLQLFRSGSSSAIAQLYDKADWGGSLRLRDLFGNDTIRLDPDASGEGGGFLWIGRNTTSPGFVVDGNYSGSGGNPRVEITGSSRSAAFRMDQTGDASVVLPTSAISAVEILDEPGVASNISDGPIAPAINVYTELRSASITAPAGGYVLVMGTCEAYDFGADDARAAFGVSNTNSSLPANQDVEHQIKLAASEAARTPVAVHGLFSVTTPGTYTYYFLCRKTAGGFNYSVSDIQLTLAYFPTAHGTVVPTVLSDFDAPVLDATAAAAEETTRPWEAGAERVSTLERQVLDLRDKNDDLAARVAILEQLVLGLTREPRGE
jgi:hypothetical protein